MTADAGDVSLAHIVLAFSVVIALLVGLALGLKYIKTKGLTIPGMNSRGTQRLQILESLPLDVKRRVIILRCDDSEHLLLLGHDRDIVIDSRLNKNRPSSA